MFTFHPYRRKSMNLFKDTNLKEVFRASKSVKKTVNATNVINYICQTDRNLKHETMDITDILEITNHSRHMQSMF
jgi:hypothetical protein